MQHFQQFVAIFNNYIVYSLAWAQAKSNSTEFMLFGRYLFVAGIWYTHTENDAVSHPYLSRNVSDFYVAETPIVINLYPR